MKSSRLIICLIPLFLSVSLVAQNVEKQAKKLKKDKQEELIIESSVKIKDATKIDPLTPSRAAFYSAILPGLGQAYNKKYWKIPIVVGGIVGGIMVYDYNNKQYNRYRDAYKSRLAGFNTDEFWGTDASGEPYSSAQISLEALQRAQETTRRNKELSLLITIGIYALNIIDANVDAHLLQYNVDDNLAIKPHFEMNEFDAKTNMGLTVNFNF